MATRPTYTDWWVYTDAICPDVYPSNPNVHEVAGHLYVHDGERMIAVYAPGSWKYARERKTDG